MRLAAVALAAVLAAGCATAAPPASPPRRTLKLFALDGRDVRLAHASAARPGQLVAQSAGRPRPLPLPPVLSMRNQRAMDDAEELYSKREYQRALVLMEPVYRDEPENAFVLEAFGRYLFRLQERSRAYETYARLVGMLDREWNTSEHLVVVDLWFLDAYWKLGQLSIARADWQRAAFEISRAIAGDWMWDRMAIDQALTYLTQVYFELGDADKTRYYAERALVRNPENSRARHYLERLPAGAKER